MGLNRDVTADPVKLTVMSGWGESEQPKPSLAWDCAVDFWLCSLGAHVVRGVEAMPLEWYRYVGVSVQDQEWSSFICTYADSMCLPLIADSGKSKYER